jgi:hypothetical protein
MGDYFYNSEKRLINMIDFRFYYKYNKHAKDTK